MPKPVGNSLNPAASNMALPQQLHQALYSLRDQFNPHFSNAVNGGSTSSFHQMQQECPLYVPPEDPNYLCNLDRLLEAITPCVSVGQLETTSVKDFFRAFRKTSVFGLRVELLNELNL